MTVPAPTGSTLADVLNRVSGLELASFAEGRSDHVTSPPRTWPALSEAVAIISAQIHGISGVGLSGDVPAGDVVTALAALAAALLTVHYPDDHGARFLRDTGASALTPEADENEP